MLSGIGAREDRLAESSREIRRQAREVATYKDSIVGQILSRIAPRISLLFQVFRVLEKIRYERDQNVGGGQLVKRNREFVDAMEFVGASAPLRSTNN